MAGKQIYLNTREIDSIRGLVEWEIERSQIQMQDIRDDLHRAVARRRVGQDLKPERKDFNPLLPDPEGEYQAVLARWSKIMNEVDELVQEHREEHERCRFLKRLYLKVDS